MNTIGSTSLHSASALRHTAVAKPAPLKVNDGDADDAPRATSAPRLATSGPGQLIDKHA